MRKTNVPKVSGWGILKETPNTWATGPKSFIFICLAMGFACVNASDEFVPPRMDLGEATLVSLETENELQRSVPDELGPVADAIVRVMPEVAKPLEAMVMRGPGEFESWEYIQFKLAQEDFFAKCYGDYWEQIAPRVLLALDSMWVISRDSASVFSDTTFMSEYAVYREAAAQFTAAFEPVLEKYRHLHSVHAAVYGSPILSVYSSRASEWETKRLGTSLQIVERFCHMYGGSVIPVEAEGVLSTGKSVFVRYFSDRVHLVFGYFPEGTSPYDVVVILDSPVPIRLPESASDR